MADRPIDDSKRRGETEMQYLERMIRTYQNETAHALAQAGVTGLGTALSLTGRRACESLPIPATAYNVGRASGK